MRPTPARLQASIALAKAAVFFFHDIHFRNVTRRRADQAMVLVGLPESPMHNITFENVTIRAKRGVTEEQTKNITTRQVKIGLLS